MKKLIMLFSVLITVATMAGQAEVLYTQTYDVNAQHYLACALVDDEVATVIVDIFGLADLAETNSVCSAYAIDCDGVYEVSWSFNGDRFAIYTGIWQEGQFIIEDELEYVD